jgi:hypothetical protein
MTMKKFTPEELVTVRNIAREQGLQMVSVYYHTHGRDFPLPVMQHAHFKLYDRDAVRAYFKDREK